MCGCSLFARMSACSDHRNHLNCDKSHRVTNFSPLPRLVPPQTRPPTIQMRRQRNWWVCLLFILLGVAPAIICSCSRSLTISRQMIIKTLLYWDSASFALPYFPLASMCLFTQLTWLTVFCMVTESCFHLSIPALQSFFCMSIDEHFIPVLFVFFQAIHATFTCDLFFGDCVKDSIPCGSSEMVAHQCPIPSFFRCTMALSSSDFFDNSKLCEWLE